jgi:hypothetical protein
MSKAVLFLPALVIAGAVAAQNAQRPNPNDPKAKVPPIEYRSAFEGYRPFTEQEASDWRKANEEVARPSAREPSSKPKPGHGPHK